MSLLQRTSLQEMTTTHLEMVRNWRNQPSIRSVMYEDEEITLAQHQAWFENIQMDSTKRVRIFYLDDQPLGVVQIKLDMKHGRAEWGFYIGHPQAPRGIGKIMGYLALEYIFQTLSMRKLCAEILSINIKSLTYHKKFGFQVEGHLKDHVTKGNQFADVILMALFANDWKRQSSDMLKQIEG